MRNAITTEQKEYKELEIILSSFACDKNCPYCTAKITKWEKTEDDICMLSLNAAAMKELGYSFHYVTLGGNGEPGLHSLQKLKDIVEIFDGWDIPVKRVLTSGSLFRAENREKWKLFVDHGWMFEVTVTSADWEETAKLQGYDFNYFDTSVFQKSAVRLNYVLLKKNINTMIEDVKSIAITYPNIKTIGIKLLNVNTYSGKSGCECSNWIVENAVPKSERETVAQMLHKDFIYQGEQFDTGSWTFHEDGIETEIYFSWKKMPYGFSDLVWYGNRFVNYQLETINLPLPPKIYIAARFIKERSENGELSFSKDFRTRMIGCEDNFMNFNSCSFIRDKKDNGKILAQYVGPFYNEKASDGEFTNDSCRKVVMAENRLVECCDIFAVYFDKCGSYGGITEMMYALRLGKKIFIYFEDEGDINYNLKSSSWYPITFAMLTDQNITAVPVCSGEEAGKEIEKIL